MQAQIKKRSLLTLTCLLRFNKFFLECSHLSLKIVTIKSHYWVTWGHWSLVANATRDQWPQVTHQWLYIVTIFRDKWLHSSKNLLNPRSAALRLINNQYFTKTFLILNARHVTLRYFALITFFRKIIAFQRLELSKHLITQANYNKARVLLRTNPPQGDNTGTLKRSSYNRHLTEKRTKNK